jgi:hypothetical protein
LHEVLISALDPNFGQGNEPLDGEMAKEVPGA